MCGNGIIPRNWEGGECDRCGSVSVNTLPTEEQLNLYYQTEFNKHYTGGGESGGRNLMRYARRYFQIVGQYVRAGKLIDVGSSKSPFPNLAAKAGFDVTVIDYTRPEGLDMRVHYADGNLNDESVLDNHRNAYDVVTSWAVLEHVRQPDMAAKILSGMCRPGGMIFLSTPEIGTFITQNALGRSGWFKPPMHLHLISPQGIKILFRPFNCRLLHWGRLELNPIRFAARYGLGLAEAGVGWPLKFLGMSTWRKYRDSKKQRFRGISFYILKRDELANPVSS
jgi:2-polyprenyl-3-methyl-5-hydroxy-6-metoxy-1,4-benzoquinol methylase